LVLHGADDEILPAWQGKRVYQALASPYKRLWVNPDANHNDLLTVEGLEKIVQFLQSVSVPAQ
jgi:fermentation-respiration switch protein FrsA (DUF1100 family)